ncbi:hypothetical protein [Shouchella lehensis]|uniref:hypothetical protein n=1 Tax=Shouchella lehensis TaxID=300825 RepID=UPI001419820C|nr:hypothetical protein [Shouchella lehensis]
MNFIMLCLMNSIPFTIDISHTKVYFIILKRMFSRSERALSATCNDPPFLNF